MRILAYPELRSRKGIPYTEQHLRRLIARGLFPAPIELSEQRVGFLESDIDEWIASRPRKKTAVATDAEAAAKITA
jgi:prophage regulatory protein